METRCPRAEDEGHREESPPSRARTKVIVRVDLPALLRGHANGGETCEIAGFDPVAVSAVRDLLDTADPFPAVVVTDGEAVVGVAHLGRRPRGVQQTALEWLYPTCAAEGWALVEGGKRPFVAPDDHRHPRHSARCHDPPTTPWRPRVS